MLFQYGLLPLPCDTKISTHRPVKPYVLPSAGLVQTAVLSSNNDRAAALRNDISSDCLWIGEIWPSADWSIPMSSSWKFCFLDLMPGPSFTRQHSGWREERFVYWKELKIINFLCISYFLYMKKYILLCLSRAVLWIFFTGLMDFWHTSQTSVFLCFFDLVDTLKSYGSLALLCCLILPCRHFNDFVFFVLYFSMLGIEIAICWLVLCWNKSPFVEISSKCLKERLLTPFVKFRFPDLKGVPGLFWYRKSTVYGEALSRTETSPVFNKRSCEWEGTWSFGSNPF